MSEESDAAVVVVSEETGAISVAIDSRLQRGLSPLNLQKLLTIKLSADEDDGHTRHRGLLSLMDKLGRSKKKPESDTHDQK
jgi:diadenylate cyclase